METPKLHHSTDESVRKTDITEHETGIHQWMG